MTSPPTMQGTGQQVPAIYTEMDAILNPEIQRTLPDHFHSGISLYDIGEALIDSYIGCPDMIKLVLSWTAARSLDGTAMLRTATEQALKARGPEIVAKLDEMLLKSAKPPPAFIAMTENPHWRQFFSTLSSDYPNSTLRYRLDRQRQLSEIGVSHKIYEGPQTLWQTIQNMLESEFKNANDVHITPECLNKFYDQVAIVATEDEDSCMMTLRLLYILGNAARSKFMRRVSDAASSRVCAAFTEMLFRTSRLSKFEGRRHTVSMRLSMAIREEETMPGEDTFKSIFALITPIHSTSSLQAERRRIDKAVGNILSIYRYLLDKDGAESQSQDVRVIDEDDDAVVEAVSESLSAVSVRFALMRALSYPDMREDLTRTAFTQWCDFSPGGAQSGPAGGMPHGDVTDKRRRSCVCLMLAHADIAGMLSDEKLRNLLSNPEGTERLRKRVKRAEGILKESTEACITARAEIERGNLRRQSLDNVLKNMKNVTVASGIIMWADEGLTGGRRETQSGESVKGLLSHANLYVTFLEAVIREHPVFTKNAVGVLQRAASRNARKGEPESVLRSQRQMLVKTLGSWVKFNGWMSILESFLNEWAPMRKLNNEDFRIFITAILEIVAPPYSSAFSTSLTGVLRHDRIVQAVAEDNELSSKVLALQSTIYKI